MKRNVFILFVCFISMFTSLYAQNSGEVENKIYQYCAVWWYGSSDYRIKIEYGFSEKEIPQDESGNEIRFNNRLSVVNYMTLQGWEYIGIANDLVGEDRMRFRRVVTKEEAEKLIDKMKHEKKKK